MKKLTVCFLALLLVLTAGFVAVWHTVDGEKDQVTYGQEILFGAPSAAEGLKITAQAEYNAHLFWKTVCYPENFQEARTDFEFFSRKQQFFGDSGFRGIDISNALDLDGKNPGIEQAYADLTRNMEPGTEAEMVINLGDYCDYYPLRFSVYLPGVFWQEREPKPNGEEVPNSISDVNRRFREFFRLPVPENSRITVEARSDPSGQIVFRGYSLSSEECYTPYSVSNYTDDTCFFALRIQNDSGQSVDPSLIPGGYGIYSVGYESVKDDPRSDTGFTGLHAETLRTFFPLEEEAEVIFLRPDPEQENLLAVTKEQEESFLRVIRISDGKQLQKLKIWSHGQEGYNIQDYDDFWVLENYNRLAVVQRQEDGTYAVAYDVLRNDPDRYCLGGSDAHMAFDGEKLAVAGFTYYDNTRNPQSCDLYVAVYDKTGMLFCGNYPSSLTPNLSEDRYEYFCRGYEIHAQWE